ncbi:MAG: hypothetical protein N2235_10990, partial [Fischerella sp.]|nr:hypothetical protein [Fischerella sp.]
LLQRVACSGGKSERFEFADGKQSVGQKLYSLNREVFGQLIHLVQAMLIKGYSPRQVVEVLMPA